MTNDQRIHNQELIRRSQELNRNANAVGATILAELLNLPLEEVAKKTSENAEKLLEI